MNHEQHTKNRRGSLVKTEIVPFLSIVMVIGFLVFAKTSEKMNAYVFYLPRVIVTYLGGDDLFLGFDDRDPDIDINLKGNSGNGYFASKRLDSSFGGINLNRISEFSKADFRKVLISSVPENSRGSLREYIDFTIEVSEKYGVDPFWILSVMWTESQFETKAESHKGALGLMQIMPDTATHISKIIYKGTYGYRSRSLIYNPYVNIEMGTYYLSYLLKEFHGDYRKATVAYNVGPNRLRQDLLTFDLTENLSMLLDNYYYYKVKSAYSALVKRYSYILAKHPSPFEYTYVVVRPKKLPEPLIEDLFPKFLPRIVMNDQMPSYGRPL